MGSEPPGFIVRADGTARSIKFDRPWTLNANLSWRRCRIVGWEKLVLHVERRLVDLREIGNMPIPAPADQYRVAVWLYS